MTDESEAEMDYEEAVTSLMAMFPHIRKEEIIKELTAAGIILFIR